MAIAKEAQVRAFDLGGFGGSPFQAEVQALVHVLWEKGEV